MAGFDGSAGIASNAISDGNTAYTAIKLFWATSLGCRDLAVLTPVDAQVSLGSCTASQFSVAGVGTLSLNFSFPLPGKVGASSNSLKLTLPSSTDRSTTTSLMVGVDMTYNLTPAMSVRPELRTLEK